MLNTIQCWVGSCYQKYLNCLFLRTKLKLTLLKEHLFTFWHSQNTNCGWLMLWNTHICTTSPPPPSPTLSCCLSLAAALPGSWSLAELPASISVIGARHTHHSFWCVVVTERGEQGGGKGWGQMWAGTVQLKWHTSQAARQARQHIGCCYWPDTVLWQCSAPTHPLTYVVCVWENTF